MVDHRGHWPAGGSSPDLPPYVPVQNINLNVTVTLSPETATLLHGLSSGILAAITALGTNMAKTLDDILAAQATALAKATANTNALASIKTILDADTQALVDLRAQLAAAGQDPAKLQAVADGMDALIAQSDSQADAEAAMANTPAG